jgi:hypothetical protein
MKNLIIFILFGMLLLCSGAHSAEPVKKTRRGTCFESSHPNYDKVKDYVATYKTLEDCRNSGGITPIKTS